MSSIARPFLLIFFAIFAFQSSAAVTPEGGGYRVSFNVNLLSGTSNGSDVEDVLIFAWNDAGDFSVESGGSLADRQVTELSNVIPFRPTAALVLGWGAAIPGVGDEKDHLFMLAHGATAAGYIGKKWSEAFPGVPPEPRTGHNAMIDLLRSAAGGDAGALAAITTFIQREASAAGFNPAGGFRVIEWSTATPIDPPEPANVPVLPAPALWLLVVLLAVAGRLVWPQLRRGNPRH